MIKIIFICTGNICRSAMAKYYAQSRVIEIGRTQDFLIDSAGICGVFGNRATISAIKSAKEYGVDMSNHTAKNINEVDLKGFDYIFVMTRMHKKEIISIYPTLNDNVYTLKEFANDLIDEDNNEDLDIRDPWAYNQEVYDFSMKEIKENIDLIFNKI